MMGNYSTDTRRGAVLAFLQFDRERMQEGKKLLETSAKQGDPEALALLSCCYFEESQPFGRLGFFSDPSQAHQLLHEGVLAGSACGLLLALRTGKLTPSLFRDMPFERLKEPWERVQGWARKGDPICQYLVGACCYYGDVFELEGRKPAENPQAWEEELAARALPWLEEALAGGMTDAGELLMRLYSGGHGIPADTNRQRQIVRQCAQLSNPRWEEQYAFLLSEEPGKEKEAFWWFERSASHGHPGGFGQMGLRLEKGIGVEQNLKRAALSYEEGARLGDGVSQSQLGRLILLGVWGQQDDARAFYWLSQGVKKGYDRNDPLLGLCFHQGRGVRKDYDVAFSIYLKVIERENQNQGYYDSTLLAETFYGLGELCERGLGCPRDVEAAKEAYASALKLGSSQAGKRLEQLKIKYRRPGRL